MALQSAAEEYRRQRTLTALAIRDLRRGADPVQVVNRYQLAAATSAETSVSAMLAEQEIPDAPVARINPAGFMSGGQVAEMVGAAANEYAVERVVVSLVQDANRSAVGVAAATRPEVTAHVRYLNPPSCSRCAILAGRAYRWSQGFQRHPLCDCVMVPTTMNAAPGLISDPMEAFERGQIRGLSRADTQAIRDGADIGQVVNIRRKAAGLSNAGEALTRGGRLTPAGVYQLAKSRDEAIALFRANGYLSTRPVAAPRRPLTLVRQPDPPSPIQTPTPTTSVATKAPPVAPRFGKTLTQNGKTAPLLKGKGGKPFPKKAWDDVPWSPADTDYRYIADPDDRATGVLQYWIPAEQASKQAAANLKAGRGALDGVDLEDGFAPLLRDGYDVEDLRADITATAHKLVEWERAEESLGTVFKGINYADTKSWDEVQAMLRSDDWNFSSVTPRDEHARWYAGRPDRSRSVVFEIEDAYGIRLDSVGNHSVEREYLMSGRIEILSSEFRPDPDGYGDRLYVKARQVR